MSFLYFKSKFKWKTLPIYMLILITILLNFSEVKGLSCDQVAAIPPNLDSLLPQYEKLKRIHLSNYFFLEAKVGNNGVEPHVFSINVHQKSIFKLQIIPKHKGVEVGLKINSVHSILESSPNIPIDFTEYEPIGPGTVEISFTPKENYEDEMKSDLRHQTAHDPICNEPYMHVQIYLEEFENFKSRMPSIQRDAETLEELEPQMENLLAKIIDLQMAYQHSEKTNRVKNLKVDLQEFKLTLPHGEGLQYYWNYNISVINEFDIKIPEEKIDSSKEHSETQFMNVYHKYSLKFQLFLDFFLGGSLHLVLIRTKDLDSLADLNCLNQGVCIISDVPQKNSMVLEAILTPGNYKILLLNLNLNYYLNSAAKNIRKSLNIDAIPISAKLKIQRFTGEENRYNCEGRHLPSNFDYLMYPSKLQLTNLHQNYFEYKGEIVMNLQDMNDYVDFTIADDSFIRVVAFHDDGVNVAIELYELENHNPNKEVHVVTHNRPGTIADIIKEVLSKAKEKSQDSKDQVLHTLTKASGENNGLIYPLYKNKRYRLVFNYENSMFEEYERKSCEMFYVKIAIDLKDRMMKAIPNSCAAQTKLTAVENLLIDLVANHDKKEELSYITPDPIVIPLKTGEKNSIIYSQVFELIETINLNVDVISDFVSSYVVPVIIPFDSHKDIENNLDDLLHHKYNLLTLHDNSVKVKLNKGKYLLVLINGVSQLYSNDEFARLVHPITGVIKCISFKLNISSIRLSTEQLRNWECNNVHYSIIPSDLNILLNSEQTHFTYHNKHLLLPRVNPEKQYISTKIKTSDHGYFLRLVGEYIEKNRPFGELNKTLEITITKNNKVLEKAKSKIIEKEFPTDQQYLNYFIQPNSEYELRFTANSDLLEDGWSYYEYCRLFKLEINLLREDALTSRENETCEENTPKLENVVYERIIGRNNSFYKYGTKSPLQIFTSYVSSQDDEHSHENRDQYDLEYIHPNSSLFIYKFNPNQTKKQNSFKYEFEIKSNYAMATILVEVPYSSLLGFSAKILRNLNEGHELIATEDMEEEGLFTIRNLLLEAGKYTVIFYPNTSINKLHSKYFTKFESLCAAFSASVLIENKPFEYLVKGVNDTYETCPYLTFPSNLNLPGWVGPDTAFTINQYFRFELKKSNNVKRFSVKENSIFKFYIPDEFSGLFSYISLYKINANKKRKLIETYEKQNNFINTVVMKGTYQFEFKFKLVDDSELNEVDSRCQFFDVYIAILPVSNIIPGIDSFNTNNIYSCDEKYLNFNNNDLKPNTSIEFFPMTLRNMQVNQDHLSANSNVKKIKLLPAKNSGKFIGELIYNNYIDGLYEFVVFKVILNKNEAPTLTEIPTEIVEHENFVWIFFHFEKNTEYQIEIITGNSDNYSSCSNIRFSYSYEEYSSNVNEHNTQVEEYLFKKDTCKIEDHLPHSFFDNKNNILDKYGGPQDEVTGELNFFGEFLLPRTMTKIRADFIIKQKSILYLRIIPKYQNALTNFIKIEVFRDKNILFRIGHDDYKGIFMYELDHSAYDFLGNTNRHSTTYFLNIDFDRILLDCESFEFVFSIIPKDLYNDEYLSCNDENQVLPEVLTFDKTTKYHYMSHLKLNEPSSQFKRDDENAYLEKSIKLVLPKPTSIEIILDYVISDNMMDIVLEKEGNEDDDIEIGDEFIERSPDLNGVLVKKEISVDLKKGTYILKIVYHQLFTEILRKFYSNDVNNLCFPFDINIETYVFKNLKNESQFSNQDTDENDPEIHHLSKEDFTDVLKNYITLIDPPELSNIKLKKKFEIEIKFTFYLEKGLPEDYYNRMIYLQDTSSSASKNRIYPSYIKEINMKSIKFVFDTSSEFAIKTCYRLFLDDSFKSKFNDESLDQFKDTYCTINCDCNSNAGYKCSSTGKCLCHHPYTGTKCEKCKLGYAMNIKNKCVDANLLSIKCDDKKTCSGHGTCQVANFDGYAVSTNTALHPCKCDEGFASYNTPFGEAIDTFCDSCKNPSKTFPFCGPKHGNQESDSIDLTFDSDCNESKKAISLPPRLYSKSVEIDSNEIYGSDFAYLDGGQDVDGSLDMLAVFNVKKNEEITELLIPEDSIIRVFYESREINRAKVMILENKYNIDAIAYTDGVDKTESFIAKLDSKESPYYLKVMHQNLKSQCNKFRLKIVIKPYRIMLSELKCRSHIDVNNLSAILPSSTIDIGTTAGVFGSDKLYYIPDNLIFQPNSKTQKVAYDYTQIGVLSKAATDEEFVYNVKLEIKTAVTFSANILFDFLNSDISLVLRDRSTKILKNGEWLIPEENLHTGDHDFINELNTLLDPGVYYLSIVQNISANHIMQIIYENENLDTKKAAKHINRCFKFKLNIQTIPINKPDVSISTTKYESMFNRLISVEPESYSKINISKKFEIFLTFESPISSVLKTEGNEKRNQKLSFRDAFYFENIRTKEKIQSTHAYLQGTLSKVFLILFEENVLMRDECYELKYKMDILQSSYDKEQKVISDYPIVHKYCTKNCDCNPYTDFECDEATGKCLCEEPYQGEGCFNCIDGWIMMRGKCITQQNCRNKFCSGHGKCVAEDGQINSKQISKSRCECDSGFTTKDCSSCLDPNLTYPDCHLITKDSQEAKLDTTSIGKFLNLDNKEFTELDSEIYKCEHSFVPHNLDTLGYLHLDGSMHINGKYSIKHINSKHYSMVFTPKEKSHVKLLLEHSNITHVLAIFLLDNNKKVLHNGTIEMGPAGYGSSTFIDFVIDPIKNPHDNSFASYELKLFIKDFPLDESDLSITYDEDENLDNIQGECFTVFMELQIIPTSKELSLISAMNAQSKNCMKNQENIPKLFSHLTNFDSHALDFNKVDQQFVDFTHIRNKNLDLSGSVFFHYEYMYVPDLLNKEFVVNVEINSKFLNSHVGVLLEIIDIPTHDVKLNYQNLTSKMIEEIVEKNNNGKRLTFPACDVHCFSGIKKFNSVVLSRVLPTDTFARVWLYDVEPVPKNLSSSQDFPFNKCLDFELKVYFSHEEGSEKSLSYQNASTLCVAKDLPTDLNNKEYLGDHQYIKKWGFHILDYFRIDKSIEKGMKHDTFFEIKEFHLMRLYIFNGRVDTDLELFSLQSNNEIILIAKSSAKNFEDVIVIEIPPGKYKIEFKFYAPPNGFHKCESIKMEFSMNSFSLLQPKLDKMMQHHKVNLKVNEIDISEHLSQFGKDIMTKDPKTIRYNILMYEAFKINVDDAKKYESSISISDYTFIIQPEDNNKLELISFVNSDFLYIDANVYLSTFSEKGDMKNAKIIAGKHKKNFNLLFSGTLEAGTYVLSIRYYRRLRYKPANDNRYDNTILKNGMNGEIEFDAMFINKSKDNVNVLTSKGHLKIPPASNNSNSISHNWFCRSAGLPIPKSLSSLRFLEFSEDSHILGNYLVPVLGLGQEVIKIRMNTPGMMIRIYVECHDIDIDLKLIEKSSKGDSKVIAKSNENTHFETIMELIYENRDYEIELKFKGFNEATGSSQANTGNACLTFKMEIAVEKQHNYACPQSSKYALLTDLKAIPAVLPVKENSGQIMKSYQYDSKKIYLGDSKNSGFVYMIRKDHDETIKYADFTVESEIDLKIEITNDFLQAPVNIFLTSSSETSVPTDTSNKKEFELAKKALGLKDAFIIAYGQIYENRSTLLIKNLPEGDYHVFIYLPRLKSKFEFNPRVCSIYDILVEAKKSRNHFREKEIVRLSDVEDNTLDPPVFLPETLNIYKFLRGDELYINYIDEAYMHHLPSENGSELVNKINFKLKEESIVTFFVHHDLYQEHIEVEIEGQTPSGEMVNKVLKAGDYKAVIRLRNIHITNQSVKHQLFSNHYLMMIFIAIAPVNRVTEIYSYNNLQSTYKQCVSTPFPQALDYDENTHTYSYHNEFFKFNRLDLNNLKIGEFKVNLTHSNNNRIIAEIGSDYALNQLNLKIRSENREWETAWSHNVGDLDILVPQGIYTFIFDLDERIIVENLECIIFSIEIHIIDNNYLSKLTESAIHPLYSSHVFESSHKDNKLLAAKCEGSMLPLEIHKQGSTDYHKIKDNGDYLLHINKALYFVDTQHSLKNENMNEVDINLEEDISLVRIRTLVENPNEYQIISKMKMYSELNGPPTIGYYSPDLSYISHNMKERNNIWFLQKNIDHFKEFYILELIQEKYEQYTPTSSSYNCPTYTLDILIQSIHELVNRLECPQNSNKLLIYTLPATEIPPFKAAVSKTDTNKSYHEKIDFGYFTEKQYSEYFFSNESFTGFQYGVRFTIEGDNEYHINMEFGYDQVVSLFDVYLSKYEEGDVFETTVVTVSEPYFDKGNAHLPYKRIINAKVTKGKYVILIVENIWDDISRTMKIHSQQERVHLCLPFSYSLDILPANDKSSAPEIISVFPPGPISFKSIDEDLNVKVILSKPPFTKNHQPITHLNNFMNIINSFYLIKKTSDKSAPPANFNQEHKDKVFPSKMEGSINNKEWTLLFLREHFEPNFDYQLAFDDKWIYDVNYTPYKANKSFPIFRVEVNRESIFQMVDNIKLMKDKMNDSDFKVEKEETTSLPPPPTTQESTTKCGPHGKFIYDNILRKSVCTCFDGFSGKFCNICNGTYDKKLNKCILIEDDDENSSDTFNEPPSEHISTVTSYTTQGYHVPNTPTTYKSCDGVCVHGFCDSKIGKCVCEINWTGSHCDQQVKKSSTDKILPGEHGSSAVLSILIKSIIGIGLIWLLYYIYSLIKNTYLKSGLGNVEYNPLPTSEYEMPVRSINNNEDSEFIAAEEEQGGEFEMSQVGLKQQNKGKKRREKANEL